jgi:hypothetical protein
MKRLLVVTFALTWALAITGCPGSGPSTTEKEFQALQHKYSDRFYEAYGLLSGENRSIPLTKMYSDGDRIWGDVFNGHSDLLKRHVAEILAGLDTVTVVETTEKIERPVRTEPVAEKSAEKATTTADKAAPAAEKSADKAAPKAEKSADKAAPAAEKSADKATPTGEKAPEKTETESVPVLTINNVPYILSFPPVNGPEKEPAFRQIEWNPVTVADAAVVNLLTGLGQNINLLMILRQNGGAWWDAIDKNPEKPRLLLRQGVVAFEVNLVRSEDCYKLQRIRLFRVKSLPPLTVQIVTPSPAPTASSTSGTAGPAAGSTDTAGLPPVTVPTPTVPTATTPTTKAAASSGT